MCTACEFLCSLVSGFPVVGVAHAVVLIGVLCCKNRDTYTADRKSLIFIAGILAHFARNCDKLCFLYGHGICSSCAVGQQNALPISKSSFCGITDFNGEVNSLKQLCTAVDTADYYLVLKRKIPLVYDFKGIEVKLCARLPQNVGFAVYILEAEALPVKGIAVLIDNIDL